MSYSSVTNCLMKSRLGATFSLAPLLYSQNKSNEAYLQVIQQLDGDIYEQEK